MPEASAAVAVGAVVEALTEQGAGAALELLAVAESFDDRLAEELLEQFAGTNGNTTQVLATVKSLPFLLRIDTRQWTLQPAVRAALVASLRDRQEDLFRAASAFLTERFVERVEGSSGRPEREALWFAALQTLPIDAERTIDCLETLTNQATSVNRSGDVDASAALAAGSAELRDKHAPEVAYFVGRQAYARNDRDRAAREFRHVLDGSQRQQMRAIAGHLLANILLRQDGDPAEAERLARESLLLHVELRSSNEVAHVEVTLARAILRSRADGSSEEVRALLDDAAQRFEHAGNRRGLCMALSNRARCYLRTGSLGAAKEDARQAIELAREFAERRELLNALTTLATVLIADGGKKALAQAQQIVGEGARIAKELGDEDPVILHTRSLIAEADGNIAKAIELTEEELFLDEELGRPRQARLARARLSKLRRSGGRRKRPRW